MTNDDIRAPTAARIELGGGYCAEPDATAEPWWDIYAPDGRQIAQMREQDVREFASAMQFERRPLKRGGRL